MNTRLSQFINYATGGNRAEFARRMGWSPQYVNGLLKGGSFGIDPVVAILDKFPELDARWMLLGEGAMLSTGVDAIKQRLLYLLELERYLPVMTADEQRRLIAGDTSFDRETIAKWHALLAEKEDARNTRFADAFARQKRWLDEAKND